MPRSPLLTSILTALSLAGCGQRMEVTMCVDVEDDVETCPAGSSVDVGEMFSMDRCDIDALEVTSEEGVKSSGFDGTDVVCCYEVVAIDHDPNSICAVGRPCLEEGVARVAPVVEGEGWSTAAGESAVAPAAVTAAWAGIAALEHGSVASFARLTVALMRLGAPPELLAEVQAAAADEVLHAQAAFGVLARLTGRPQAPGPFPGGDLAPAGDLVDLAVSTWREGCVGETLGALLAQEGAARATDPGVRAVWERIAADEARHAALSWRIVGWAVATGGRPVRDALREATRDPVLVSPAVPVDDAAAEAWGCLGPAVTEAVLARGHREVIAPALAVLLA